MHTGAVHDLLGLCYVNYVEMAERIVHVFETDTG